MPDQPATPELNKALAAFQTDLPRIVKSEHADAGKFGYDYAGLDTVSLETMPPLGKHGLAFTAFPGTDTEGRPVLDYALLHDSGEERTGQFPLWLLLPERVTAQQIGGYITYGRRYCLCSVTGVAPGGEDNDATPATETSGTGGRWMNRRMDVPPPNLPRTPTKTTGADHEQLRDGTVEAGPGDRPATRVKAEQNGDADPWLDQPPGRFDETPPEERTGSIDGRQRSQIFAKLTILGITDAAQQRTILGDILRRPVSSRAGLSYRDAETVLKDLTARVEAKEAAEEAAEQDAAAEATQ
jgi:hypothetical protein